MNPFYYVLSVNGLLFALSLVFYFFPPKKINALYGYRTNRTIINDKIWEQANTFFRKQLLIYASITLVASLFFVYMKPDITWQPMALMLLSLAVSVIKTEQELNKSYDREGNKKK